LHAVSLFVVFNLLLFIIDRAADSVYVDPTFCLKSFSLLGVCVIEQVVAFHAKCDVFQFKKLKAVLTLYSN